MKKLLPLIVLFVGCNTSYTTQKSLTDWSTAFAHSAEGKTVRLVLEEVSGNTDETFSVFLDDGGKEYYLGSLSFYAQKKG